jgi:hypothetical protein
MSGLPEGLHPHELVEVQLDGDSEWHEAAPAKSWAWQEDIYPGKITGWRRVAPVGDVHSTAVGSGARYNAGKPPLELIPLSIIAECARIGPWVVEPPNWPRALELLGRFQMHAALPVTEQRILLIRAACAAGLAWEECASVLDYGRKKYAEWNWAKGQPWSVPIASGARHALAALRGEEHDAESAHTHRGHFLCNVVFLLFFMDNYPQGDDRRLPPTP